MESSVSTSSIDLDDETCINYDESSNITNVLPPSPSKNESADRNHRHENESLNIIINLNDSARNTHPNMDNFNSFVSTENPDILLEYPIFLYPIYDERRE
eukprot:Awhi_evm1s6691